MYPYVKRLKRMIFRYIVFLLNNSFLFIELHKYIQFNFHNQNNAQGLFINLFNNKLFIGKITIHKFNIIYSKHSKYITILALNGTYSLSVVQGATFSESSAYNIFLTPKN